MSLLVVALLSQLGAALAVSQECPAGSASCGLGATSLLQTQFEVERKSPPPPGAHAEGCAFVGKCGAHCIGTSYGGRMVPEEAMTFLQALQPSEAMVWSFGMGTDISFDVTLACLFGFRVDMFDPSPHSAQHFKGVQLVLGTGDASPVRDEMLYPRAECAGCKTYWQDVANTKAAGNLLVHHAVAIATRSGNLTFYRSRNQGPAGSWSLDPGMRDSGGGGFETMTVPAQTMESLLSASGVARVDVLKLDIEGLENFMLEQTLLLPDEKLPKLIFVDFDSIGACLGSAETCGRKRREALAMVEKVKSRGYRAVKFGAIDYTFFLDSPL